MIDLILFAVKAAEQIYPNESGSFKKAMVMEWLLKQNIGMSAYEISHHINVAVKQIKGE